MIPVIRNKWCSKESCSEPPLRPICPGPAGSPAGPRHQLNQPAICFAGHPCSSAAGVRVPGADPSCFGPWRCLNPRDHRLPAGSSLPSVAKATEACRNRARTMKFLQFGITGTHFHIKTTKEPSSCMLLSLTLLHTHSPAKGGDKLSPQTGQFSPISKPCFKHTSGKLEQPKKKKNH